MTNHSFNLIDQPWIVCSDKEGEIIEVSWREFFSRAHEIRQICGETPLETAAILLTSLAILQRICGPKTTKDWEEIWQDKRFSTEKIEAYFDQWYERFDLFHPVRPFYQWPNVQGNWKSVLYLARPSANNPTLFEHKTEAQNITLTPAEAARALLVAQTMRLGGGKAGKGNPNYMDSTFARGILFFVEGDNIFETLVLNLIGAGFRNFPSTDDDKPTWEMNDPFIGVLSKKENSEKLVAKGYLHHLTWQTNRIWLKPEQNESGTVVREFIIIPFASHEYELSPHRAYRKNQKKSKNQAEKEFVMLYFNTEKALWRDYHSLIDLKANNVIPPRALVWLAELRARERLDKNYPSRLMAIGSLSDQGKYLFYRQERLPLPLQLLGQEIALVEGAIQTAEEVAGYLDLALKVLAEHILMRGSQQKQDSKAVSKQDASTTKKDEFSGQQKQDSNAVSRLVKQWGGEDLYWERLENAFWDFIHQLSQQLKESESEQQLKEVQEKWNDVLCEAARDALSQVIKMNGDTAPVLHGQLIAERILNSKLKELKPEAK